ncbi:MAG: CRISPR-associated helicase Cas3', partial [Thermodesulfobacteriota bacterium]
MEDYLARIADDGRRQRVIDHLNNVGDMAYRFAKPFKAEKWGQLAGLWHDVGKFSPAFQKRIGGLFDPAAQIEQVSGKPDHSTAGAQHANGAFKWAGLVLAYAIAGHHAGLANGNDDNDSCLFKRLQKKVPDWSACPEKVLHLGNPGELPFAMDRTGNRAGFQVAFFIRMLFSCLVDADFLDTENFMVPEKSNWRGGYPTLVHLHQKLGLALQKLLENAEPSDINTYRAEILRDCLNAAEKTPGLFSLTVPTGGGKTISSLAFALKHALKYGMRRIIYVIPYTSIIEQNAQVFRDILGEEAVLEHHSTYEFKEETNEDRRTRLASENWDAPVIVTTSVQFFESLFHNRSSRCRKLHNISGSVVILDEAQMLPVPFIRPCVEALRELTSAYNSSIVLCTATQPALSSDHFKWRLDIPDDREIIPEPNRLYQFFKRVKAEFIGRMSDESIAEKVQKFRQGLCVVNTRKHARTIYEKIEGENCYHLSALMCPVHRSQKLEQIRNALKAGESCRVVSTQLIEAGVDIDFPVVFRSAAGIDSIAQAAGRCNREGKLKEGGQLFVFLPEDGVPPGDFRLNAETAEMVMQHHEDILSPDAVWEYFETNFWRRGDDQLDREGILQD